MMAAFLKVAREYLAYLSAAAGQNDTQGARTTMGTMCMESGYSVYHCWAGKDSL